MEVLICIKCVIRRDEYDITGKYTLNPYDLHVVQYLMERKEQFNLNISCLCMGNEKAEEVLKYCYALGIDGAYLISDNNFVGSDTYSTSYIIANAIKKIGSFDAILCGSRSIDGETGQVPFGIAQRLDMSSVSGVTEILQFNENNIVVKREYDNRMETIQGKAPILLVFNQFSTEEPIVNFMQLKRVRNRKVSIINSTNLDINIKKCGLAGSLTKVLETEKKIKKKENEVLDGSASIIADRLCDIINENNNSKV